LQQTLGISNTGAFGLQEPTGSNLGTDWKWNKHSDQSMSSYRHFIATCSHSDWTLHFERC